MGRIQIFSNLKLDFIYLSNVKSSFGVIIEKNHFINIITKTLKYSLTVLRRT